MTVSHSVAMDMMMCIEGNNVKKDRQKTAIDKLMRRPDRIFLKVSEGTNPADS